MMKGTSKFLTSVSLEVIDVGGKGVGCGHLPSATNQHVTKCYTRPRTWTGALTRPTQRKMEMIQLGISRFSAEGVQ
jgi:hypothetical protein